jgi:molecular chaperone GrpE (heat shock protein)
VAGKATETVETTAKKDQTAQRAAYGKATQRLRDAHRADFDRFLTEEYAAAGVEVRRRLSDEERAARKAEAEQARRDRAYEKAQAKIAALREALAKAQEDALPFALESVVTADQV